MKRRVSVEKEIRPWVFGRLKLTGGPSTVIYGRRGRRIDRSNLSKCAFFFESAARHAASRNGRTRPRRKRPPADYVCSVTTSRRLGQAFRNISCPPITQDLRACVAATLLFFARFSSVLLPLLLYFSRRSTLLLRSAVSPFIEAVYRSVRRLGSTLSVRLLNVLLL